MNFAIMVELALHSLCRQGSIEAHFVTVVIVRDVDELNGVIEQYRQGVTVAGQNATVTVVAGESPGMDNGCTLIVSLQ